METYKGKINEYVDWVSGIDSRTNLNVTQDLPASGQSVRQLLQEHLKRPFIKYDDVSGGQYIFFSSEDARDEWLRLTNSESVYYDLEKASAIPITTMTRPSDTSIDIKSINVDGSEGEIGDSRYIISGDTNSATANIQYVVRMYKEQGGAQQNTTDSFTVTYTITSATGSISTIVEDYNSNMVTTGAEKKILSFNCYQYLSEGTNNISFVVNGKNSGATFSRDISVYLVKFQLTSSYDFSKAVQYGSTMSIPVSVTRSVSGMTLNIFAEVANGSSANKTFTPVANVTTNSSDNPYTTTLDIQNTFPANSVSSDHIQHCLKIYATLGSGGSATQFTSNAIYFTFETASSVSNLVNKFVNVKYDTNSEEEINGNFIISAIQYEPVVLNWSYYTDHMNYDSSVDIYWYLRYKENNEYREMLVGNGIGSRQTISTALQFIPEVYQTLEDGATLVAKYYKSGTYTEIDSYPIIIAKSSYDISEASDAVLKLSAFGKSNTSNDRDQWIDSIGGATTTFTNISYDDRSGWSNNGLFVQGVGVKAVVNYCPLPQSYELSSNGKTIEIEFTPVKSNNDDDVLIKIGSIDGGHIDIKPNGAYLYIGESTTDIVHTNYKVGERIKLAFVFNTSNSSDPYANGLVYIINNGILERAAEMGYAGNYNSDSGNITIGGSASSVRVYTIRVYDKPLTYQQELNNFIFDSTNKSVIISRNQLFSNGELDFDIVKNKIDSVLIEGLSGDQYNGLSKILSPNTAKEDSESTVNIKRTCISDDTKSFYISKAMIRKHGQSTINYPITALKFWLNKSATVGDNPSYIEQSLSQSALNLNKNRYVMKSGAIPANKFVLQANYADSSGTHNGSLLRLIQNTWYNATFGSNNEYKLRTAPQLFASGHIITHNNASLGETGWVEGTYNMKPTATNYDLNKVGKTWPEITGTEFPYTIRNAADSFPCAVFYKDPNGDGNTHFLGQYVFMDDKKSDFIYGERSIYAFGDYTDPFVMNIDNTKNGVNGKQDTGANRVWNNSSVLRIEVVLPNTLVTSYMGMNVPTSMELDSEGNIVNTGGTYVPCTNIKYDSNGNPVRYYWEDYFEMIYPDPDDIEENKFDENSEFVQTAQPFIDFLTWITGIAALNVDNSGTQYHDGTVNQTALNKFIAEAHDHLDLYKLAAYYIFFLRFGLVDSVERNAQLKTYDGKHWHYEPWDMDIALGNTNQGALVLNPPLSRDSVIPGTSTKAFSGRSESTSNFMWDCLEAWDYWSNTLVPEVAEALYNAGLSYENVAKMFDENYSDKWAESLYNEAGFFKYIKNGGGDYLPWLQGSRASHRHWWLSTSMNYYDAKWSCGTFKNRRIVLFVDKGISSSGTDIVTIKPTSSTYFEITASGGESSIERKQATPTVPARFDISANSFSAKDPTWIYGGLFVEELDLSCFAKSMATIDVSRCYDDILGANIKKLNIGVPTSGTDTNKTGQISGTKLRISAVDANANTDALEELDTLDITGQSSIVNTAGILVSQDRTQLENIYASGTSIISFENAPSGNTFADLVLPSQTSVTNADGSTSVSNMTSFVMHSASWQNLEFWNTTATSAATIAVDEDGNQIFIEDEDGNLVPVYNAANANYVKQNTIPSTINTVVFDGSTARNKCSLDFVLDWIDSIKATLSNPDDADVLHQALKTKTFRAENINWTLSFGRTLTYQDLENIAYLNGTSTIGGREVFNNNTYKYIKGYVVLNTELSAEQMVNIKRWFGDSAFDKSATSSQLVVDSNNDSVVINIDNVTVSDGVIQLNEGGYASMLATKFLLGDSAGDNIIISNTVSMPTGSQMMWSLGSSEKTTAWGSTYNNTVSLQYNEDDGRMHLVAERNHVGDFTVCVRVSFLDKYSNTKHSYLTVKIIGTTYPTKYNLTIDGVDIRPFYCTDEIGTSLYGAQYDSSIPAYVMHSTNQTIDVSVQMEGTYTAGTPTIMFNITDSSTGSSISNGLQDVSVVNANNYSVPQGIDAYLNYTNSTVNNAVRLITSSVSPEMRLYTLIMRVKFNSTKPYEELKLNVIVYDDSIPVLGINTENQLYLILRDKYNTTYSLPAEYNFALYKSHLKCIGGTLDFSSDHTAIESLQTNIGDTIFNYLPNITSLNFTGCNRLSHNAGTSGIFDFTNMPKLTTLSLNGCTSMDASSSVSGIIHSTLSLSTALQLTSLDLRNTTIGVDIPQNSRITTLQLGSPYYISIVNPVSLSPEEISIQSSSNLSDVTIQDVNQSYLCGFTMFDKIYNPS